MYLRLHSGGSMRLLDEIAEEIAGQVAGVGQPIIGFIPAASEDQMAYVERVRAALAPVGTMRLLNLDTTDAAHFAADVAACHALFMPGGNTYLLTQRMHNHNAMATVRAAVRGGVPLFTVSAGTVFCGPNMLTTNDWNVFAATEFDALGFCPTNFNVHFTLPPPEESESRDFRIRQYIRANHTPVLALEELCNLEWTDEVVRVHGATAWLYTVADERRPLPPGSTFHPQEDTVAWEEQGETN